MNGAAPRRPPGALVWGVPTALLLHNLEEGLTVARYLPRIRAAAPEAVRGLLPGAGRLSIAYVALIVVTVIPFGLALFARGLQPARWATYALLGVASIVLVNVGWHLAAAVVLGGYAPGLATGVLVNLPVTLVALGQARADEWVSRRGLWLLLLAAVAIHAPGLIAIVALVSLRS